MGEVRGDKGGELGFTNKEGDCKRKKKNSAVAVDALAVISDGRWMKATKWRRGKVVGNRETQFHA